MAVTGLVACGSSSSSGGSQTSGTGGTPATLTSISITTDILVENYAPLYWAVHDGIFKKNGLNVNVIQLQTGTTAASVIQSGSAQFAASGASTEALAVERGAQFQAIASEGNDAAEVCVEKPWAQQHGLTSKSSLKKIFEAFAGAKFASSGANSSTDLAAQYLVKTYAPSVNWASQVTDESLGSSPAVISALESGSIDVTVASPPACETAAQSNPNVEVLLEPAQIPAFAGQINAVFYGLTSYVQSHPTIDKELAKSIAEADNDCRDHPGPVVQMLEKDYFSSVDPSLVSETFTKVIKPIIPANAQMTKSEWDIVSDILLPVTNKPFKTSEGFLWTTKYLPKATS